MNTKTVMEDSDGQLFLEFSEHELNQMGWTVDDDLIWTEEENGYKITKKD